MLIQMAFLTCLLSIWLINSELKHRLIINHFKNRKTRRIFLKVQKYITDQHLMLNNQIIKLIDSWKKKSGKLMRLNIERDQNIKIFYQARTNRIKTTQITHITIILKNQEASQITTKLMGFIIKETLMNTWEIWSIDLANFRR